MKRWLLLPVTILCLWATVASANPDSNTYWPLTDVNPASASFGGLNYPSQLFDFLVKEDAARSVEYGFCNFVYVGQNASACLGTTGAGLTMTPAACIGYNAGYRAGNDPSGSTGFIKSITFANSSRTWVAMDENITGNNANLPNFTRVPNTHYLIDAIDVAAPAMAPDSQLLMYVTTSGGAITAVVDERRTSTSTTCDTTSGAIHSDDFGMIGDAQYLIDATITGGALTTVTSASNPFATTDCQSGPGCTGKVDKDIQISSAGTGGTALLTTINQFNSAGSVGIAATATAAVTAVRGFFGTDNCAGWTKFSAAAALHNGSVNWNPTGILDRGIYMFEQCSQVVWPSSNLGNFYQASLKTSGVGAASIALGVPTSGNACAFGDYSGASFVFNSNYHAQLKDISFFQLSNNAPDCTVLIGHNPTDQSIEVDIPFVETWGLPSAPRTTGLHNPSGVWVDNIVGSHVHVAFTGGNGGGIQNGADGQFKQTAYIRRCQNCDFDFSESTHLDGNMANGIFDDSNPGILMDTGNNQLTTIRAGVDGAGPNALQLASVGVGDYRVSLFHADGAVCNSDQLFLFLPNTLHPTCGIAGYDYVIPSTNTTVTGACASGAATCVVGSTTGIVKNQKILVQNGGAAGADDFYIIKSVDSATQVTFTTNLVSTPAGGSWIAWPAYAGHIYRNRNNLAGACTTGAASPAWPLTHNGIVASGTCSFVEYGTGASVDNNMQSTGAVLTVLGGQYGNGNPIGVLSRTNTAATTILGSRFSSPKFSSVYCLNCSWLGITGIQSVPSWFTLGIDSGNAISMDTSSNSSVNNGCGVSIETASTNLNLPMESDMRRVCNRSTATPPSSLAGFGFEGVLVANLPTCNASATSGAHLWNQVVIDNLTVCQTGATPTGGGTTNCRVWCDGTSGGWKITGSNTVEGDITYSGLLGGLTSTAATTLLQTCVKMVNAGKLTSLKCTNDLNGAACTTAPTYSTRDTTSTTNGGTVVCSTTAGVVTQTTPALSFSAGDEVCLTRTGNGGTCTVPIFGVDAHWSSP